MQCTCPFHKDAGDNIHAYCRKTLAFTSVEQGGRGLDFTMRQLKAWCLAGRLCTARRNPRDEGHLWVPIPAVPPTNVELDDQLAVPAAGAASESSDSDSDSLV